MKPDSMLNLMNRLRVHLRRQNQHDLALEIDCMIADYRKRCAQPERAA